MRLFSDSSYIPIEKAARITEYTDEYIEFLAITDKIRSKKRPEFTKEKKVTLVRLVHKKDLIDYRYVGSPSEEEMKRAAVEDRIRTVRRIFAGTMIAVFLVLSGIFVRPIERLSSVIGGGEYTAVLYSGGCEGDWEFVENVPGEPDVGPRGNVDDFSSQNSAIYEGGDLKIICGDFISRPDTETDEVDEDEEENDEENAEEGEEDDEVDEDDSDEESDDEDDEEDEKEQDEELEEDIEEADETEEENGEEDTEEVEEVDEDDEVDEKEQDEELEEDTDKEESESSDDSKDQDEESEADEGDKEEGAEELEESEEEVASLWNRITGRLPLFSAKADAPHTFEEMKEMDILEAKVKFSFSLGDVDFEEDEKEESDPEEDTDKEEDEKDDESEEMEEDPEESDSEKDGEKQDKEESQDSEEDDIDEEESDPEEADEEEEKTEETEEVDDSDEESDSEESQDSVEESDQESESDDDGEDEASDEVEDESEEETAGIFRRAINFSARSINSLLSRFGSFEKVFAEEDEGKEEISIPDTETKVIVFYRTERTEDWVELDTLSGNRFSNLLNDGYFSYDAPFLSSWEAVESLEIKLRGVVGGKAGFTAYLDSVWTEVVYGEKEEVDYLMEATKETFKFDENPTFKLRAVDKSGRELRGSPPPRAVETAVQRSGGKAFGEKQEVSFDEKDGLIEVDSKNLSPGKNRITVKLEDGTELTQDFTWGVLAINFNKPVYSKGDQAYIQVGVLDDDGHTICDADLEISIKNEEKEEDFSTDDKIKYSGVCAGDSYVEIPDYYLHYPIKIEGSHSVTLTAHTENGTRTITDSFSVEDVDPEIERTGPTRIYPPANYLMTATVDFEDGFIGKVTEELPEKFRVVSGNYDRFEDGTLEWNIDLEPGEEKTLEYRFNAPNISPEFYLIGPLQFFGEEGFDDFTEARGWQIASDDPGTTEYLYPIEELSAVNLTGDISYLQHDPNSDDAEEDWYTQTAIDPNELEVLLDDPSGHISGTQTLRFLVRRTNNSTRIPDVEITLYQDGTLIDTLEAGRDVNSPFGEVWTYEFETEDLIDESGEGLEILMEGSRTGGPPPDRNVPEYGAIEWEVSLTGVNVNIQPTDSEAGTPIEGPPTAFVGDNSGNPVEGITVTASLQGGDFTSGTLEIDTDSDGLAEFSDLVVETAGIYEIEFTAEGVDQPAVTEPFEIYSGPAETVSVFTQPQETVAGTPIEGPPTVLVEDQFGNPVEGNTVTVSVDGTFTSGSFEIDTDSEGLALFDDLQIDEVGSYQLTFDAEGVVSDAVSDPFEIIPAPASDLEVFTQPQETVAGTPIEGPPTVQLIDSFGNPAQEEDIEIEIDLIGGNFASGTYSVMTDSQGMAAFNDLTVEGIGNYELEFTADSISATALSDPFEVVHGPADDIVIDIQPQETVAGTPIEGPPTVQLIDSFGNPAQEEDIDITVGLVGASFSSGTTTVATDSDGLAEFDDLTRNQSGSYELFFQASSLGANTTSDTFEVVHGPADAVSVSIQPEDTIAGEPIEGPPTVLVEDQFGNPVEGNTVTVSVDGTFSSGSFGIDTDSAGLAEFDDLRIDDIGSYQLTFDAEGVVSDAVSDQFEIEETDAADVSVSVEPQETVAGTPIEGPPTALVTDDVGNPVEGIGVTALIIGTSFASGETRVYTDSDGLAEFDDLVVEEAGSYQLIFDAQGVEDDAVSANFDVVADQADTLFIENQPQDTVAGLVMEGPPRVGLADQFGNPVEEAGAVIEVELIGGDFDSGTYLVMTGSDGLAEFDDLVVQQAGVYELEFSSGDVTGDVVSESFEILPDQAETVSVYVQPQYTAAGDNISGPPTALVEDQFGNPVEEVSVAVTLSSGSFSSGTVVVDTDSQGLAEFDDLIIDSMDTYQLTFDAVGVTDDAVSDQFEVGPAGPDDIIIYTEPDDTVAGQIIGGPPAVQLVDPFGNPAQESGIQVTVNLLGGDFASGSFTVTTDSDGVATFDDLIVEPVGVYQLSFEASSIDGNATSSTFRINAGPLGGIAVYTEPTESVAGTSIEGPPTVKTTDSYGNPIEEAGVDVGVSVSGGGFASGTTIVTTDSDGLAEFDDLVIEEAGIYELDFEANSIPATTTSSFFEIVHSDPDLITVYNQPENSVTGGRVEGPPIALVEDQFGNPTQGTTVTADLVEGTLDGVITEVDTDDQGLAEFDYLIITEEGEYELTFSVDGVTDAAVSDPFLVMSRLYPIAEIATTNVAGNIEYLQHDPASTSAYEDWYETFNAADSNELTVLMDDPQGHLSGTQTLRFLIRRTDNSTRIPTATIELYQDGQLIDTLVAERDVTDTTGEVWTYEFEADQLDDISGENLEIVISGSTTGGGAGDRNAPEYGAIEWEFSLVGVSVLTQPEDTVAGQVIGGYPTAIMEDDLGNPIEGINITVGIIGDAEFASGTTTVMTGSDGLAVFDDLVIEKAGEYRLVFDSEIALNDAVSAPFEITPDGPDSIVVDTQPEDADAGDIIGGPPTVLVLDQFDNPTVGLTVTASVTGGFASGTTEVDVDEEGFAVFDDLVITRAGDHRIDFDAPDISGTTSDSFTVFAGPAAMIAVFEEPQDTVAGQQIEGPPMAGVTDQYYNPVEEPDVEIEVSLQGGDFTSGTLSRSTGIFGTVEFDDLVVEEAGIYELYFYSAELESEAESLPFEVLADNPSQVSVEAQPQDTDAGYPIEGPPTVLVTDQFGNPNEDIQVTVSLSEGEFFSGTTTAATDSQGLAEFNDLVIQDGGDYQLIFNAEGIVSDAVSDTFTVLAGIVITGNVYESDRETISEAGLQVDLAIDGSHHSSTTASTETGEFTFNLPEPLPAGELLTVFIDDVESGMTMTKHPGTQDDLIIDIYLDSVTVRNDYEGLITGLELAHYEVSSLFNYDTDLSIAEGKKILLKSDFTPSLSLITAPSDDADHPGGDLEIEAGNLLDMESHTLSVGGNYLNQGGLAISEEVDFTAESNNHHIAGNMTGSSAFSDVVFSGTGGWEIQNQIGVDDFRVLAGQVGLSSLTLVAGSWENQASITHNEGEVVFTSGGEETIISGDPFYDLTLDNSTGQWLLEDDLTVESQFEIVAGTFLADQNLITFTGSGTPFTVGGSFDAGASTVVFKGSSNSTIPAVDYYYLRTAPETGSPIYTPETGTLSAYEIDLESEGGTVIFDAAGNDTEISTEADFSIR